MSTRLKKHKKRKYQFETSQIRFTSSEIQFLRSRYVYKSISYDSLSKIELKIGNVINNHWIIRTISLIGMYLIYRYFQLGMSLTENFLDTNLSFWFNRGAIISVWGPLLCGAVLIIAFVQSFIKSSLITIQNKDFKKQISIRQLDKNDETDKLIDFLLEKNIQVIDNR